MNILKLQGENGEVHFEFLDLIDHKGHSYVVLMPVESNEQEVVILCVTDGQSEEESVYRSLENEAELDEIYAIFKERNQEFFQFED